MPNHKMIVGEKYFYSETGMKADCISTVTRRRDSLTFAMKKRPTSGLVTHIRTQDWSRDVSTHILSDLTVFVVPKSMSPRFCEQSRVVVKLTDCLKLTEEAAVLKRNHSKIETADKPQSPNSQLFLAKI